MACEAHTSAIHKAVDRTIDRYFDEYKSYSCYSKTPSRSTAFPNMALFLSGSILGTAFLCQMPSIHTQLNPQATHSHHFICDCLPSFTPIAINITNHFPCPRPLLLTPPNKHIAIPSIPHQHHTYLLLYTTSARHCLFQPCDSSYNFKIPRKVPAAASQFSSPLGNNQFLFVLAHPEIP